MTSKRTKVGALVSAVFLILAICICVPSVRGHIMHLAYAVEGRVVRYFNNEVQNDGIANNNYNFGYDRKAAADKDVADGKANSVQEWVATKNGEGDFFYSISVDPALCAAVALHMDESLELPETILVDEQNEVIGQRADKAHLHFLEDQKYWDRAIELIKKYLTSGDIRIEELTDYTSQMYMANNRLEGNKPSVIVRNTQNEGGHVVVFDLGKPGIVKFRLECGYQPVDVPYWTPPTPPGPPEPPEPPTPTLEPKDPDAGPQSQGQGQPGYEDFGGGQNHDNDETLTDEPQSPDTYVPPAPPKSDDTSTGTGNKPSESKPDGSTGTHSGSHTVDTDHGTTETHGGQDYTVQAGDGQNHSDLNQTQEQQHSHDTVETPVKDDGVNEGDLDPDDVE